MDLGTGITSAAPPADAPGGRPPDANKLFLGLFLQNQRRLYAYILTLLPNQADADDVLQETSMVMWDKFDPGQPQAGFLTWARQIAYHKVLDFYKRTHREEARLSRVFLERVAESAAGRSEALRLDDRREALAGCVEKLPPRDRDLLARRFSAGATTRSTSEQLGRSVEAVYKALAKVRQDLLDCVRRALAQEARP
jgi:RNA polymerase sigma-70 factor (ECF subfamily)